MIAVVAALAVMAGPVVVPKYEPVDPRALAVVVASGWSVEPDLATTIASGAVVGGYFGGVHPAWLVAVAAGETGDTFRSDVKGDSGRSLGLCQIQVATARPSLPWVTRALLLDPWWNLVAAGLHYGRLIERYGRARAHLLYGCGFGCSGMVSTSAGRAKMRRFLRIVAALRGET